MQTVCPVGTVLTPQIPMAAFAVTAAMWASPASHRDFPVATRILGSASVKPMLQVNRPAIHIRAVTSEEVLVTLESLVGCITSGYKLLLAV